MRASSTTSLWGLTVLLAAGSASAQETPDRLDAPPRARMDASERAERGSDEEASVGDSNEEASVGDSNGEASVAPAAFELFAGTTAPVDVALGARVVFFERFLITASVGRGVYGGVWGGLANIYGGDDAAQLIEPVLGRAWVTRIGVGVQPFGVGTPELVVGYARLNTSADWDAATVGAPAEAGRLHADIGLNLIFAELGWNLHVAGPFYLRPAIGWMHTLGAGVSLSSNSSQANTAEGRAALAEAETGVEETLRSYGFTPTLSLSAGFRF